MLETKISSNLVNYNEDKITLKDLADKYAISVERVRQLEKSALDRLKGVLQESE